MSSTHTQGRLTACALLLNSDAGHAVAIVTERRGDPAAEADARRLVACWNACDGVPIEVLEANQAGGLPWNVGERIEDKVTTERRMQALVDALAAAEAYIAERVIGTGGTGEREVLPALRRALEGSPVKPTQTSWGDC